MISILCLTAALLFGKCIHMQICEKSKISYKSFIASAAGWQ